MKGSKLVSYVAILSLSIGAHASADFIFDFDDADKTHIGGWQSTPPGVADFPSLPGFGNILFEVGNLTNGCGLFPSTPSRSGIGTSCSTTQLAGKISYDTGLDSFLLDEATEAVLQLFIKVGHPEDPDPNSSRVHQNQTETFDIFLENGMDGLGLAQLLDDVTDPALDLQNGYYLYTYPPGVLPTGEWFPTFEANAGSIEFLARLSAVSTAEPATLFLLSSGLLGLGLFAKRRRHLG